MSEKVIYTGQFVTDQTKLLSDIPPLITGGDSTIHAHHVTKKFKPADGIESISLGKRRTLLAIGQVAEDGVHAVLVTSPDGEPISDNDNPHITIATEKGVSPVKSNSVIAKAKEAGTIVPIEPPIPFDVVEGYFNGKEVKTS